MNEKKTKRREWVKTAAIVFLTVLLLLTFFSQTILNYSLPEVAAQYVQSGSITAKIRGTGMIESGDPYNIMVKETRKVASVAVRVGDEVQKGDVLLYLAEEESTELEEAKKALEDAREAYDVALLSADINAGVIAEAQGNVSASTYRQQITAAQNEVAAAQKKVDDWQKQYDAFDLQLSITPDNTADVTAETKAFNEAKKVKENADFSLKEAENRLDNINRQLEYEQSVSNNDAIGSLLTQKRDAEKVVLSAKTAAKNAQLAFEKAQTALENKTASGDTSGTIQNLKNQQYVVKLNLDAAQKELTQKNTNLTDLTGKINKVLNLDNLYDTIIEAQEKVTKLEEKSLGETVTADISGTVSAINTAAGKEISAASPVVILQPEGQGYSMSFSVTNEQAKRLAVGDRADLINAWRYDDVEVTLASIKPDKNDPSKKKELTFNVTGNVTAGQSLNVSVGQKSATYDLIVPNSAIREDNNGKFVLTVESKSSPLGNRYIATRVDVEVLASDDTQSAISGGLYGYEFIITTSTKPVEAGKQVRLADN